MSEPSKSANITHNRFLSGFTFGFMGVVGFLPPIIGKFFKSSSVTSEKLAPWALFGTAFVALILRDRDIRQIKSLDAELKKIQKSSPNNSKKEIEPNELERLRKVEEKYYALRAKLKDIVKQFFSLFELAGTEPLTEQELQDSLDDFIEGLPDNLSNFKGYLTQLKSDADQFLPPEEWRDDVKTFMTELSEKMANSSKDAPITLLSGKEKANMVSAVKSIYDIFTILGDQPVSQKEIEENVHGWVAVLPGSVGQFKDLVQNLKSEVDAASVTDKQFRDSIKTSVGKTSSRNSTPQRQPSSTAKQLNFSNASTTPLTKTNQSSQQ